MKIHQKIFLVAILGIWISGSSLQAQHFGTIWGRVVDDSTAMPLTNAEIMLEGTKRGTTSDGSGQFLLQKIPPGSYFLRVKYIGYQEARYPVRIYREDSVRINIRLRRIILQMPEVAVTASRQSYIDQSLQTQPSVIQVSAPQIQRVPTVGEPDLFRALQTLPGITAPSQASNQIYIRGGSPDQNLVRIDGAVVYNPFHLFGLAANFNPDLVGQVTVSTGGFSARYGDRLSGVVDVETRTVTEPFIAIGNISLLSSKLLLGGRQWSRWQWLLSGRRTYHDWAAKLFGYTLPYHFYDLFGKLTFVASPRHLFNFSIFYSADILYQTQVDTIAVYEEDEQGRIVDPLHPHQIGWVVHQERIGFPWNNLATTLRWEYVPSPRWSSTIAVSLSRSSNTGINDDLYSAGPGVPQKYVDRIRYYSNETDGVNWSISNTLDDLSILATGLWQPTAMWQLLYGLEYSRISFDYDWFGIEGNEGDVVFFFDQAPDSFAYHSRYCRQGIFVEALWQISPRLRIQPSLRADYRSTTDSFILEPRLSTTLELWPAFHLQAALGQYHQGMAFFREQGIFAVHELYFPLTVVSAARHSIVGIEYQPEVDTRIKIEAYYKDFDRQAVSPKVYWADGWAYGLEVTVRRGHWQAFYVFSRVRRHLNGLTYDIPWDVRHRLQLATQLDLGRSWDLNIQWELHTGQPYLPRELRQTIPRAYYNPRTARLEYQYESREVDYPKGALRYPIYHRLDVSFAKRLALGKWSVAPYLQIINLYNRKNPIFYEESWRYSPGRFGDPYESCLKPVGVPPLPSIGVRFSF